MILAMGMSMSACSFSIRSLGKIGKLISPFVGNSSTILTQFKDSGLVQNPSIYNRDFFGASVTYVSYTSDEYCVEHGCGATNIAVRTSIDQFASRIDVTQNSNVKSDFSKVVVAADGTIHVIYSSYEFSNSVTNLAERTKGVIDAGFGNRTDLTQQTLNDASHAVVGIRSTDEVIVAYDSREYCDANACTHRAISVRSSSTGYVARNDLDDGTACDSTYPKISVQPGNDELHLVWTRSNAGACTVTGTDNMRYTSTRLTTNFGTAQPVSLQITTQADGTLWTFYAANGGSCPGAWGIYYRQNLPNNSWAAASSNLTCGVYPYSVNWSVTTGSNDVVHLTYLNHDTLTVASSNALSHRSSADAFAAADIATATNFGNQSYPLISVDSANVITLASVSSGNVVAGFNLYQSNQAWARVPASKSTAGSIHFSTDRNGGYWMTYLSGDYCAAHACHRLNYVTKSLSTGALVQLTHFTSDAIELGGGKLVFLNDGTQDFYYHSNESNSTVYNIVHRNSTDGFTGRVDVTANATLTTLDDVFFQKTTVGNGVVHVAMANNGGVQNAYANSTDFSGTLVQLAGTENHASQLAFNYTTNEVANIYGGNESGAWKPNIRTNLDNFATRQTINGNAWSDRAADFDETAGNLVAVSLTNEADPASYNFALRDRLSGWGTRTDLFAVASPTAISSCLSSVFLQIDSHQVIHLLYSSHEYNASFCNVVYRNSNDWNHRVDLTRYSDKDAYPQGLFIKNSTYPVACSTAVVEANCSVIPQ